ncbi:MAG: trigger factor [Synergistaceae bacterium]|jgi:trigger factor|nr:trigger factor [Synergistaceae bacterium]
MKTELLGQEKNLVTIKVEFEAEEFTASLDKTMQEIQQKVNVPGFRKGHVPRRVLEMRLGKSQFYAESLEKMMPRAIEQIVGDYDLDTLGPPSFALKMDSIREGEPLVCELVFEVIPEVSLPELESIEVEKLRPKLTDEMVQEALKELQKICSTLAPVSRPIGEDDVVHATSIVYLADTDDHREKDDTPQENVFDLGDSLIRREIKEALLGKSPGEKTSVEFVVDKGNADKRVAGRKIHYDITIDRIEERILPPMTKGFYKQALQMDIDSEEDFRAELKKKLLPGLDEEFTNEAALTAIDRIVEISEVEIPDTLLNRQIKRQKQQDEEACKQRFDSSIEEYLRNTSVSLADYEEDVREKSRHALHRALVVDALRKKFDVEVSREDLEAKIFDIAHLNGVRPEIVRAAFSKNQDQLQQLTNELRDSKLTAVIREKVKFKEVDKFTANELRAEKLKTEKLKTEKLKADKSEAKELSRAMEIAPAELSAVNGATIEGGE